MDEVLWGITPVTGGKLNPRGRVTVTPRKARITASMPYDGARLTVAIPLYMRGNLLLLDPVHGHPIVRETLTDGSSDCLVHFDCWPAGPQSRGRYTDSFEDYARRSLPASLADTDKPRPAFGMRSSEAIREEIAMRTWVVREEVRYLEPEAVILGSYARLQRGHFDGLPAVLHVDGKKHQVKTTHPGSIVTKVTKEVVVLKHKKWYRTIPVPEGMEVHPRIRPGRKIPKDKPLFQLAVSERKFEGLPIVAALIETLRQRILVEDRGRQYIRLGYATEVAHHCVQCSVANGVYPVAPLVCPGCNARVDRPRLPGGVHVPVKDVKQEMQLECVRCKHTAPSDRFRRHRVCGSCGAAAVPALKRAYMACNSRYYASPTHAMGMPIELSYVKNYVRRLQQDGTTLQEVAQTAACRTKAPSVTYVA